ncbi:MAG: threonine/serine exporter [Ruminococcaceae bacterium]|nr:threonine/serine exporter [Oscillospiraceae bacterium]
MSSLNVYLIQIVTAFFGSMGFSLMYNTRRTKMLISAFGGAIGWSVFILMTHFLSGMDFLAYFVASMAVTVYAEIFARIKKTPTTSFLVTGIIPMIPGSSLYYTMSYAFKNEMDEFFSTGIYTLKAALSLAIGIIVISTAVRMATATANKLFKKK